MLQRRSRRTILSKKGITTTGVAAATLVALLAPATPGAAAPAQVRVVAPASPDHWDPLTDSKWAFTDGQVVMTDRSSARSATAPRCASTSRSRATTAT